MNGRRLLVAFDMDDTLIIPAVATGFDRDVPNYDTIAVYRWFQSQGNTMIIWSGGGADYARQWADKLGLTADQYLDKHDSAHVHADLSFDDGDLTLATVNVKVRRVNNKVIRYPDRIKVGADAPIATGANSGIGVNVPSLRTGSADESLGDAPSTSSRAEASDANPGTTEGNQHSTILTNESAPPGQRE